MNNIFVTNSKPPTFKSLSFINLNTKINIINHNTKNTILIPNKIIENFKETLFLYSIPNYVEDINQMRKKEDWTNSEQFYSGEEW